MGKKVNPLAMRPSFKKCQWFTSNKRDFARKILQDYRIRQLAEEVIGERMFADISIERIGEQTNITIHTHKPGFIISARDNKTPLIEEYKKVLHKKLFNSGSFQVFLVEIFKPELNAIIVGNNIAEQLENRMSTKSCMKKAMSYFLRSCPTGGIRIVCSGRVGGAEIARREKVQDGKMPLASIKSDVQMAIRVAHTVYGTVSVRVYIYIPKEFYFHREKTYVETGERDRRKPYNNFNRTPGKFQNRNYNNNNNTSNENNSQKNIEQSQNKIAKGEK